MVWNGLSGSFRDISAIDASIDIMNENDLNAIRVPFTPVGVSGQRPYSPEHIDYLLNNWDGTVIVSPNHYLGEVPDWAQVETTVFKVLNRFKNNRRVPVEIINEFAWDGKTVWDRVAPIIANIKAAGFTNPIIINKHTRENDWRTIGANYYGRHYYMSIWTKTAIQAALTDAMIAGCVPMVCTEVGAHHKERDSFTTENVRQLSEQLAWSNGQGIGSLLWMNRDQDNWNRYMELGLVMPKGTSDTPRARAVLLPAIGSFLVGIVLIAAALSKR